MSKYLGKILLENEVVGRLKKVWVKYLSSRKQFVFDCEEESGYKFAVFAGKDLCLDMFKTRGTLECQYKWSVGYAVRQKRDVSELRQMREDEMNMLGGRRSLIMSGQLDNDDDFDYLCAIHYLFKISETVLKRVCRLWKRWKWDKEDSAWLELEKRSLGHAGRKRGGKNHEKVGVNGNDEEETLEDALLRVTHNKRVAVEKGFLGWYLDACKEECKLRGEKFDKRTCLSSWDKLRLDMSADKY